MYWSWVLMSVGLTGLFLLTAKKKLGWFIGFFAQILWIIYAIATNQYGFIVSALAYATVNVIGILKFEKPKEEKHQHDYLSTACAHGESDQCRLTCKFCHTPCRCACHSDEEETNDNGRTL